MVRIKHLETKKYRKTASENAGGVRVLEFIEHNNPPEDSRR